VVSEPTKPKKCVFEPDASFFLISLFLRYLCGFKPPKIKKRLYTLVCVLDVFGGLTVWQHDNNKKKKETTPCMGSLVGGSGELVV